MVTGSITPDRAVRHLGMPLLAKKPRRDSAGPVAHRAVAQVRSCDRRRRSRFARGDDEVLQVASRRIPPASPALASASIHIRQTWDSPICRVAVVGVGNALNRVRSRRQRSSSSR
jgi:hypothetical protein